MKKIFSLIITLCLAVSYLNIPMVASAEGTNLALASEGAIVTTGPGTQGANPASYANDGDISTHWWSWTSSAATSKWLQIALADTISVSEIAFYSQASQNESNYTVSYSADGATWTPASGLAKENRSVNGSSYTYLFVRPTSAIAKYVKVEWHNATDKNMRINEIEVYGSKAALPYLKSLTASSGTFLTDFEMSTTAYKVQVESFSNLPTLSYETYESDATVEFTEAEASNNYTATIAVTHGGETKKYTVQYVSENHSLSANGGSVTYYTSDGTSEGVIASVTDGDISTKTRMKAQGYAVLTMSQVIDVTSAEITFGDSGNPAMYEFAYSLDGNEWTPMTGARNGMTIYFKFAEAPIKAKYIKVVNKYLASGVYKESSICEIVVYGTTLKPYLTSLNTSDDSVLSPSFDSTVSNYEVLVEDLGNLPELIYEKEIAESVVLYTEASEENGYKATIEVSHAGAKCTYYVQFKPVSAEPYLASLASSEGTLSPSFDSATSNYEIAVEDLENLPDLTWEPVKESATVSYTEANSENNYKATIRVGHNGAFFTYYIQFKLLPGNPTLSNLTVSDGSALSPAFSGDVINYTIDLKNVSVNNIPTLEYAAEETTAEINYVPASEENGYKATISVTHKGDTKVYSVQYLINWAYKDNMLAVSATGNEGALFTVDKAVDGDITGNSEWRSDIYTSGGNIPYMQVEFKKFVNISKLGINSTYSANQTQYKFSYSIDGNTWVDATGTYSRNGQDLTLTLSEPVTVKYVRAAVNTSSATFVRIKEFYAFGVQNDANPFLSSLSVADGEMSPEFNPNTTYYELPIYSLTDLPVLSYTTADDSAEVVYTPASEENGYKATVKVTHNGISFIYNVKYNLIAADSTELKFINLSVNGGEEFLIDGFDKSKTEYLLDCNDMDGVPVISAEAVHKDATVEIEQGSMKNMVATITVTSADGQNTQRYTIMYLTNIALNCSAWANSAYSGYEATDAVDGNMGTMWFASSKVAGGGYIAVNLECMAKIYNMTVYNDNTSNTAWYNDIMVSTDGTTWEPLTGFSINNTTVSIDGKNYYKMDYVFSDVPVEARYVRVSGTTTSSNNSRISELIVNGIREPMVSADASLKEIKIGENALTGFSSYVSDYTVSLGAQDSIPVVSATASDISANVEITQATESNPVAKIVVTAENGASKMTYTVTFEKQLAPEKNTYLSSLSVARGTLMPEFTPANTSYTLYLTPGSEAITADEITAIAAAGGASVIKTAGNPSTVTVTSSDTTEQRRYTINIAYASANLAGLTVTGYELQPAFSPSVTDYTIELQAGEGVPLIGVELDGKYIHPVAESGATITLVQPTEQSLKAVIIVQDENGILKKNYTITFNYAQSLANAQESAQKALKNFTAENDTTADEILNLIKESVTNDAIDANWSTAFSLKKATTSEQGLISGAVTLSYGDESVVITIRKAIDKLVGGGGGSSSGGGGGSSSPAEDADKDNNKEETPSVDTDPYAEIRGHWAEKEVIYLAEKGIVKGNGESFALNDSVTRAEFITMLIRAGEFDTAAYDNSFIDVSSSDWYAPYIQAAFNNGFISGYDGMVNPTNTTTREEAVKMLVGVYENLNEEIVVSEEKTFADSNSISPWAKEYIQKSVSAGLVQGFDTGEFKPKDVLTRAQAMVMIYRLINNN